MSVIYRNCLRIYRTSVEQLSQSLEHPPGGWAVFANCVLDVGPVFAKGGLHAVGRQKLETTNNKQQRTNNKQQTTMFHGFHGSSWISKTFHRISMDFT